MTKKGTKRSDRKASGHQESKTESRTKKTVSVGPKDIPQSDIQREVLPIPDSDYIGLTPFSARDPDAKFPPIQPLRPPEGSPNVVIVLLDDVGFGASSAFGGVIQTPTAERLANRGLKYNRFHTTALCSPTRSALLTGRNHHAVGFGGITEIATSAPGYTTSRPNTAATVSEILNLNGYNTAQFGKCHEVPVWESGPLGPFNHWPTGSGFEYFYGFIAGETNQYYPSIYEGTMPVEPKRTPEEGYHFMEDMTDKAIDWVQQQRAMMPQKPFFMYFAPGATHAPHHVPKEWADKYKGKFDKGWDQLREEIFARQKKLGVIPQDCELTRRPSEIPAWDDMPEELKPVLAREMEVYAGFLEYADFHVGRLIETLEKIQALENTLVFYIIGDNGASAEGSPQGTFNEGLIFNDLLALETPQNLLANIDKFGGPDSYNHYAVGWAHAMDTPYQWTKQVASHWGGTRNGMIAHWPKGIRARGEIRQQFHHVIDVLPTILEVAGLPHPVAVNGVQQMPIHGVSMAETFADASAPENHETQYFEMFGNRGIYHKGWMAVTKHRTPWVTETEHSLEDDVWELYDTNSDWSQARNLADELPEKLAELQTLFLIEAAKYHVLPLDDRSIERFNSELAGRPELLRGDTQFLFGGMNRIAEDAMLNIKNKSHSVTADIVVPERGARGVIIAQGGRFGGWSLYVKDDHLKYCYNFVGLKTFDIESKSPLPRGAHQVRMEFEYDGGGLGKGGDVRLYVDGKKVGEGRVEQTMGYSMGLGEATDIGRDTGSLVSDELRDNEIRFNGDIKLVQIDRGGENVDHLVTPQDRLRIVMAMQ